MNPAFLPLLTLAVMEDLSEVRKLDDEERRKAGEAVVDTIAGGADWLIRGEKPRGGKAGRDQFHEVWKATVRAVAVASMQPGGVELFGQHWDASKWPLCGSPS